MVLAEQPRGLQAVQISFRHLCLRAIWTMKSEKICTMFSCGEHVTLHMMFPPRQTLATDGHLLGMHTVSLWLDKLLPRYSYVHAAGMRQIRRPCHARAAMYQNNADNVWTYRPKVHQIGCTY